MVLAHDIRDCKGGVKRTTDVATDSNVTFDAMLLAPRTVAGLSTAGFTRPSPVQLQGIPTGKCGFNLLLEAKSGTGKTAVFTVIALDMLNEQTNAQIMILAPTREIAAQIADVVRQIGSAYEDLTVEVVMGGLPVKDDIEKFANKRKVHVIVGSPGRLRQLIENNHIDTSSVRLFVLDEADKLMLNSFKVDINYIFSTLPNCKQVIMSSATYPESLKELVVKYMKKYVHIRPNSTSVLLGIEQKFTVVKHHSNVVKQTQWRYHELVKIFKSRQFKQCLIFCNYQARVVEVCKKLKEDKWPAHFLHGKQEQTDRLDALRTLQDYKCRILVTTDLAARGIDASNVDLIVNFEIPYDWATYLHRIGRAGRYGSYGMAISILSEGKEEAHFKKLLKDLNGPINIGDLWNECGNSSNANGHGTDKHTVENGSVNELGVATAGKPTDILWSIINGSDDKDATEQAKSNIEDFENLIASYSEAEGIESFNDLMSSFDESKIEKTYSVFRTLKVNYSTIPKNALSNIDKPDLEVDITKEKPETNINLTNGAVPQLNAESSTNLQSNTSSGFKSKNTSDNNKERTTKNHYKGAKKNKKFNNNYCLNNGNLNNQNDDSDQNIEDADTYDTNDQNDVFSDVVNVVNGNSQSQHHRKKQGNNKNRTKNNIQTARSSNDEELQEHEYYNYDHTNMSIDSTWKPVNPGNYQNITESYKKYEMCSNNDDDSTSESVSESNSESESESNSGSDESSHSSESESDEYSEGENIQAEINHRNDVNNKLWNTYFITAAKNYEIWKKKLAARRAQIQMAVYIEEMGKLSRM